ncbi:MAG: hypothetical protein A3G91_04520 [Omnitrophica WOR_2 bacterium RIFCSPLOWO2_12_FULL_50_9]|nr:MAG: hypothetical protein A3D87_03770 [Omnitrophica WOR_2 bacterium RIFCSPHIGHO2_02_FULL_50_17]OGX40864.1 MAG: hypothetical protein A3G91_04520 [Omnitrophica WOR_2 bacterium RIFCSPLOWO2_12_FULL_50_9]
MSKKILVIDDEPQFVQVLKVRLEANGYGVVTAGDGMAGLETWKKEKPDLIILDIMMPELDGYSFVQDSKTNPDLKPCPIIVLTAKPGFDEIFKIEGVKDYIVKPFNDKELLEKIRKHLGEGNNA